MDAMDLEIFEELIIESQEHLATIEPDLMTIEHGTAGQDPQIINRVFRGIHSIKGGFGFLGVEPVQRLTHAMESVLMKVRDGQLDTSPAMVTVMLAGVDCIRAMMADIDAAAAVDASAVHAGLQPWLDGTASAVPAPAPADHAAPAPADAIVEAAAEAEPAAAAPATAGAAAPAPGGPKAQAQDVLRVKVDLLNQLMNQAGELVLARNQIVQALDRKLGDTPAGQTLFQAIDAVVADARRRLQGGLAEQVRRPQGEGGALDDLLEREYAHLLDRIRQALPSRLSELPGMNANMVNLDSVTTALQENIMRTRMQNLDTLFGKLPRQVRDLSLKTGREVYLEVTGGEVELDKSIVEALSDPLNHMIRNSLDHGIEPPEERVAAGKPRTGRLRIRSFHEGGQVNIAISDDGRGIDPARIRAVAVKKGVVTEAQAAGMDDREAVMLIMAPGFSTAEKVSDISGRGVGMDVVRSNIEALGGSVAVDSRPGAGTTMTLKLPLTLAIIPSLLVKVAGRRFAVPQVALEELVRLRRGAPGHGVECVQGAEVMRLRERLLPLVRLDAVLGVPGGRDDGTLAVNVLVLKVNGDRYGLVVDEVLDSEEIVVKLLPSMLKDHPCYAGATIMGDGGVAMILDAVGIATTAGLHLEAAEPAAAAGAPADDGGVERTLLLFRNHPAEQFAVDLATVARIEAVPPARLQRIGDREFLKYEDDALPLVRVHDVVPVTHPGGDPDELFVIIPRDAAVPFGIVATNCEDVAEVVGEPKQGTIAGPGVLGSMVLDGNLTILLDAAALGAGRVGQVLQSA